MKNSGLAFAPYIYVFPAGSTSYQPLLISDDVTNGITVATYNEIPAMSIFMVRVSKSNTETGSLVINKGMQVHSTLAHNVSYPSTPSPAPIQRARPRPIDSAKTRNQPLPTKLHSAFHLKRLPVCTT
ncbi:MAG: hypothetical protein GX102_00150 [Porphyromonadaceae bacterium]|nr:hypothetical protein [Porphyromonadaceae bacterium]